MRASRYGDLIVEDLMFEPVSLPATASVRDAAIFLARAKLSVVPIVSPGGRYEGLVADDDIHRRLSESVHGFHSPEEVRTGVPLMGGRLPDAIWKAFTRVGWLPLRAIARDVVPLRPGDSLPDGLDALRGEGLAAMPVVDGHELVGILHADAVTMRLVDVALPSEVPDSAQVRHNPIRSRAR